MHKTDIENEYFEWMYETVCHDRFAKNISYRKLLEYLHDIRFKWKIPKDNNRAADGIELRRQYNFYCRRDIPNILEHISGPCSVLEMMVALAIRCETDIMHDSSIGDRTTQWFWKMIVNLGLGGMTDDQFDKDYIRDVINKFLNREYEPDGRGGLFTVRHCEHDLRKIEIWIQLLWFLDTIT